MTSLFEIFYETWQVGGPILLPLFIVGFLGFYLVLQTFLELGGGLRRATFAPRFEAIRDAVAAGKHAEAMRIAETLPHLIRFGVTMALEHRGYTHKALRQLLDEKLQFALYNIEKHLPLIRSLAASAPLLGLLGTVHGLIKTFRTMTEYGSSSGQLLAAGISEALIATQTGLLIAIVLILLGQRLEGQVQWLQKQVEYGLTTLLHQLEKDSTPLSTERHA